tara:strand:+ start:371 stop:607 length:237 start_codon:yes stop_codon:yes gene_type:complete
MDIHLAQTVETLGSGTGQQILSVIVGLLIAALTWLIRLHLKERDMWEKKFEALHEKTLGIALKVQATIIKLGEMPEED